MKWFKHMTQSHSDEKLAQVLSLHGPEGYGFWWLLVEIVASQTGKSDDKCSVAYPITYWMRLTGIYHLKKLRILVECMNNLKLMSAQCPPNVSTISALSMKDVLTISMPNILKYRDEYTKKTGQKKENVPSRIKKENKETEEDKEKDKRTPPTPSRMTLVEIRTMFRTKIGQELGGGVNQTLVEICNTYTPEAIEFAITSTSTRAPLPTNPFTYFQKVLKGEAEKQAVPADEFDVNKDYPEGSFYAAMKADILSNRGSNDAA